MSPGDVEPAEAGSFGDEVDEVDEGAPDSAPPPPGDFFFPMPVSRLIVFGLLGGWLYGVFWFYKNWQAYRRAWGYSSEPFWRDVHAATGYRISASWRALLSGFYCLSLFPAVQRECKANRVAGLGAPFVLAASMMLLAIFGALYPTRFVVGLIGQAWALVPVQLAINRLNRHVERPLHVRIGAVEAALVVLGAIGTWSARLR